MSQIMESGFDTSQQMRTWVSPSLIEANHILALSQQELHLAVNVEIAENPALEFDDRPGCARCGAVLNGPTCPVCRLDNRLIDVRAQNPQLLDDLPMSPQLRSIDDEFDPLMLVATREDVLQLILRDVGTSIDHSLLYLAEYLVASIDSRGILDVDLEALPRRVDERPETIDAVIRAIQEVSPPGVGARSVAESLHLQVQALEAAGVAIPVATAPVITNHLDDLAMHRHGSIARALGVDVSDIEEAREFIRTRLSPSPLQLADARTWQTPSGTAFTSPDVVFLIDDEGALTVDVVDRFGQRLHVNPLYEELAKSQHLRKDEVRGEAVNAASLEHIRNYSSRARMFIGTINQRRSTLLKISRCIAEMQDAFLHEGVRSLRPLTRAVVAQQVGVHESTVSRATANKYAMLPNQRVIPFSDFFTPSLSVKDVIKELMADESANGEHYTDRVIVDMLEDRGIRVARRTVAKYRAELGILSSAMR